VENAIEEKWRNKWKSDDCLVVGGNSKECGKVHSWEQGTTGLLWDLPGSGQRVGEKKNMKKRWKRSEYYRSISLESKGS